jgi:hypothetical protein
VSSSSVTLQLVDVSGNPISPLTIKPTDKKAFILVNGKETYVTDLNQGDSITFWVPQSRMEVNALPSQTGSHWNVLAEAPGAH